MTTKTVESEVETVDKPLLTWRPGDDGVWHADSLLGNGGSPYVYDLIPALDNTNAMEDGPFILGGDKELVAKEQDFPTLNDAKAEAERLERTLTSHLVVEEVPAAPTSAPVTTDDIGLLRDHDRTMRELAHRIAAVKAQWIDAKELAADYKKRLDGLYEDLAEMAREQLGFGPLFDSTPAEPQSVDAPVDPNAWRSVAIDALLDHGVTAKHVEKLHDADITTLGKLADMSASGLSWFKDVKGIGEAAADKIQNAAQAWHLANMPKPTGEPEAEANDEWWIKPVEALEAHGTTPDDSTFLRACGFTSTEAMIGCPEWNEFGKSEEQSKRIEHALEAFYVAPNDRTITDTIDDVSPL
jgi:hypothetical protein